MRLKRDRSDEKPIYAPQPHVYDQSFHTKILKTYDKSRLPPGKYLFWHLDLVIISTSILALYIFELT